MEIFVIEIEVSNKQKQNYCSLSQVFQELCLKIYKHFNVFIKDVFNIKSSKL